MNFFRTKTGQSLVQFCKFGMVGVLNNVISLAVYYIVVWISPHLYLVGNALGFLISTLNAYLLNSRFVFSGGQKEEKKGRQVGRTYAVYTCSLLMSTVILYVLVDLLQVSDKIAPIFSLMVTIPFNFLMNKFWVYRKADRG